MLGSVSRVDAPVSVDLLTDDGRLDELAPAWDALLRVTPGWSGFQSHAWIMACRRALPSAASPFVLHFRAGGETIGLMPTEITRRGELRFIGGTVTSYGGLLYRPERVAEVMRALEEFLADERRLSLVDLRGLRARSPATRALLDLEVAGWARPRAVQTADCPSVDLAAGWPAVYGARRSSYRSNVSHKSKALERLGSLEFREVTGSEEARALLPCLFDLFRARWDGRHESGGFADRYRSFHEDAVPALADAGHLRVSVLQLAGRVVAFSYGIEGERGTSSYVLGHANALAHHSPGLLLLVRLLEAAAQRRDAEYDLSIGDEGYKRIWATGSEALMRVIVARRRQPAARVRADWRRLRAASWVGVRSITWLRDVRREGMRLLVGKRPRAAFADRPGLAAGRASVWRVYRVLPGSRPSGIRVESWDWVEMMRRLSPRLLYHAAERSYRGDRLLVLACGERTLGIVWQACDRRQQTVTGGASDGNPAVYYHPVAATGVARGELVEALRAVVDGELVLVAAGVVRAPGITLGGSFPADHAFRRRGLRSRVSARLAGSVGWAQ